MGCLLVTLAIAILTHGGVWPSSVERHIRPKLSSFLLPVACCPPTKQSCHLPGLKCAAALLLAPVPRCKVLVVYLSIPHERNLWSLN